MGLITFLKIDKIDIDGQQIKKMFKFYHYVNVEQRYNIISPIINQNIIYIYHIYVYSHIQIYIHTYMHTTLVWIWLARIQNEVVAMETVWPFLKEVKTRVTIWCSNLTFNYIFKRTENKISKMFLYLCVHYNIFASGHKRWRQFKVHQQKK